MTASKEVTGFGIHLKVKDIAASRKFYEGYLGLKPVFAYGDDEFRATIAEGVATAPEKYHGITYGLQGGANLEIADGHIAVHDPSVFPAPITSPKISAMIKVTSLLPFWVIKRTMPLFLSANITGALSSSFCVTPTASSSSL